MPQKVPLVVPKKTPVGSALSLIAQDVMSPEPVTVASSGKSACAVLFVSSTDVGV